MVMGYARACIIKGSDPLMIQILCFWDILQNLEHEVVESFYGVNLACLAWGVRTDEGRTERCHVHVGIAWGEDAAFESGVAC